MPVGYYNINDAFESALRVYTTTTPVPSVIYGPAEPLLDPGNLYAWRVRALSVLHPTSLLFQNEGYSEVVAFFYHDGIPGGGVCFRKTCPLRKVAMSTLQLTQSRSIRPMRPMSWC